MLTRPSQVSSSSAVTPLISAGEVNTKLSAPTIATNRNFDAASMRCMGDTPGKYCRVIRMASLADGRQRRPARQHLAGVSEQTVEARERRYVQAAADQQVLVVEQAVNRAAVHQVPAAHDRGRGGVLRY